jgi:hypothetical protein
MDIEPLYDIMDDYDNLISNVEEIFAKTTSG